MSLQEWCENHWIHECERSANEIANLLAIAEREISDAGLASISSDGRFSHAYNAVRALCTAALHACGYRAAKGSSSHKRLIESLGLTVGEEMSGRIDYLDRCRRHRNRSMYDQSDSVQPREADELLVAAKNLQQEVRTWFENEHADLL